MLKIIKKLILLASFIVNFNVFSFGRTLLIPVYGIIDYTQECIIRRGLKYAQEQSYKNIMLDIDTPGGSVGNMLNIIDNIQKSKIYAIAYIHNEAISAGSFIANVCDKIYFHPQGIMGAAAIISGDGKNLGENLQAKMDSYLWAKIRTNCEKFPHRYAIQRAMMDKDFILKAGKTTLKPSGELLTLTAQEALKSYPELPALSSGTFPTIEELLQSAVEDKTYDEFIPSGFERLAQIFTPFVPIISGFGFFLLLMEFKTPGFGLMGLLGIGCLAISIMTHILAGLGGTEAIAMLGIGIACVFLDLLVLGTIFIIFIGFCFIIAGLWWSGIDVWPTIPLTIDDYLMPLKSLGYALFTWALLLWIAYKLGWIKHGMNRLTLSASIKLDDITDANLIGRIAETMTPLIPSGKARIDGKIIEVKSESNDIPEKTEVIITAKKDFSWVVKRNN